MRIGICLFASAFVLSSAIQPSAVTAQEHHGPPCEGDYNIVRVSDIKPGMTQKFLDAVAAQQAWYKNAGTQDKIVLMRIYDRDSHSYSTTQMMTSHISPSGAPPVKHDAAFEAFANLYHESSTIKYEYFTCASAK
jgi:hypothetical protein